jgi:hypothetical protein
MLSGMQIPFSAARQHGCFTTAEALAAGWTTHHVKEARKTGQLRRLRPGVWIQAETYQALGSRARHLVHAVADLLVLDERWHAAHKTAAILTGLPLIGDPPQQPQLAADPASPTERSSNPNRKIAPLPASDRGSAQGVRTTKAFRTAVDIARTESFRDAVVVAAAVLAKGVSKASMEQTLDQMDRWPGVQQARTAIAFADGRSESALESVSRVAIHLLELPPPELQVKVYLGTTLIGRVDKLWRQFNTVGEDDGLEKFGDGPQERQESFKALTVRGQGLEDVGLELARWGWDDAFSRSATVLKPRLLRAFARGSAQTLDPGVRFVTTGVPTRRAA